MRKSGRPVSVDIVIPYYRALGYLREAVESVRSQTFTNFRLLVIDDSPNDLQAQEYITALNDPRISFIRNEINLGLNMSLHVAVEHCDSEWMVFLGHDDCLFPEYLEQMLKACEQFPTAALVQSRTLVIDNLGRAYCPLADRIKKLIWNASISIFGEKVSFKSETDPILISYRSAIKIIPIGNFLYFPLIMWKREFIRKVPFRLDLLVTSDIDFLLKIFVQKGDLLLVNKVLGKYRRHEMSLSEKPDDKLARLKEESSTYNEMSHLLKGQGFYAASFLCLLRPSTRLYAFYEMAISLVDLKIKKAAHFMWLGIR
jgi:glycosyltransferase involved in cell wall biosynthesis